MENIMLQKRLLQPMKIILRQLTEKGTELELRKLLRTTEVSAAQILLHLSLSSHLD
ncbi:hypothetical protein X975_00299, partial [Stegodyphus mimosarum]